MFSKMNWKVNQRTADTNPLEIFYKQLVHTQRIPIIMGHIGIWKAS